MPMTMNQCDGDRQMCSTTGNLSENDSLYFSTLSPHLSSSRETARTTSRPNSKEKRCRSISTFNTNQVRQTSLKRAYSFVDQNQCRQVK